MILNWIKKEKNFTLRCSDVIFESNVYFIWDIRWKCYSLLFVFVLDSFLLLCIFDGLKNFELFLNSVIEWNPKQIFQKRQEFSWNESILSWTEIFMLLKNIISIASNVRTRRKFLKSHITYPRSPLKLPGVDLLDERRFIFFRTFNYFLGKINLRQRRYYLTRQKSFPVMFEFRFRSQLSEC